MSDAPKLIRRALETDAAAIAQVHLAAWRSTYRGIVDQDYIDGLSFDDFVARWHSRLSGTANPLPVVLVATDKDNVVGFISGGATRDASLPFDAELYAIYILQEFQGQGIGRTLVSELVVELREQGHTSLCVKVLTDNPARRFYERLGGQWIRTEQHAIGGREYETSCYGWQDLESLHAALTATSPEERHVSQNVRGDKKLHFARAEYKQAIFVVHGGGPIVQAIARLISPVARLLILAFATVYERVHSTRRKSR